MAGLTASCQCRRFGVACDIRMTQEDLLCGICRGEGCDAAIGTDDSGPCAHVRLSLETIRFSYSLRPPG